MNYQFILRQYIKIAFRNILKFRLQSFIAVFGLAFALLCFVPALYWMRYETTYDSFYPDANQIYRIYSVEKQSGKINERVPGILSKYLLNHFPAIEASTDFAYERFDYNDLEKTNYIQLNTICADSSFFRIFPQESVVGNLQQALQIAGNMVLTESSAVRLFGNVENAIGQKLENPLSRIFGVCTVVAVVSDSPENTNLPFDALLNYPAVKDASMIMPEPEQWNYFNNSMYVKLRSQTDIDELAEHLSDFTSQINTNPNIELRLLPIVEVRHNLDTNLPFTLNFIRLLVAAGILLMFSASFNFLNLYLGLFRQRIHEFRQRMIHGATTTQLVFQMMFEQICSVLLALLIGVFFILITFSWFSKLLGIEIVESLVLRFFVWSCVGTMLYLLAVSFIPCWRLIGLVKGNLSARKTNRQTALQRIAISLQLAVSIVFIVAVSVITMQMNFVSYKDLGFNPEGIIQLYASNAKLADNKTAVMQKLEAIPQVLSISTSSFEPRQNVQATMMTSEVDWSGKDSNVKPVFQWIPVGDKFIETFNLELLEGRWWKENENNKVVLNEEAVRTMELDKPIGTIVHISPFLISSDGVAAMEEYEVIGVVKDFHSMSFRSPIYPCFLRPGMEDIWYVRVAPGQEKEVIRQISSILPDINESLKDVRLTLLEELYDKLNYSEQVGLKLFSILALVSLLTSLFGIYAVAVTTIQRHRKEIAIRKVLGAKVYDIVRLFVKEYALIVVFASLVSFPAAYLIMDYWLESYAYHIDIKIWWLIVIFIITSSVVLLTIWKQVFRAACENPAEVVKSE